MSEEKKPTFIEKLGTMFTDPYPDDTTTEMKVVNDEEEEAIASPYEQPVNKDVNPSNYTAVVIQPASSDEAYDITDYLLKKKACVVNIHRLDSTQATRLIDFLTGAAYATKGSIQKIDDNVYLIAPKEQPVLTHTTVE